MSNNNELKGLETAKREMCYGSKDTLYYGYFLMMTQVRADTNVPTACAYVNSTRYGISISPTFWSGLKTPEKTGILLHELLHIMFFHVKLFSFYTEREIFNIAADFCINSIIKKGMLPAGALFPEDYDWKDGKKFPSEKDTLWYYTELLEQKRNNTMDPNLKEVCNRLADGTPMEAGTPGWMSQHDWEELKKQVDQVGEIVNINTEVTLKKLYEDIVQKSRGTIPASLEQSIKSLFEILPPVVNWKKEFRMFTASRRTTEVRKTRHRESKRFEDAPGTKKKKKQTAAFIIDTSGSVSEKELCDCFSEIHHLYKSGVEFEIIECDANIARQYWYTGKWDKTVAGRGGTRMTPAIEYVNKHSRTFDVAILYTDGYIENDLVPCNVPLMCLISSKGTTNVNIKGKIIKIP